ncbi:flavodoxin domain-containing protein [Geomicrobium sp. JSM 1781026]|uniref:flavodoxin domain-containing protein n=1 Tax=Geomicrobium sp. JSM 1781026 TaxID=3344580 RepID=UPI0035C00001
MQASMRTLVLYESLSGNTSRLAAIIAEMLEDKGAAVTIQPLRTFLNLKKEEGLALIQDKQKILIGTYTDDTHEPPELVEELLEEYDLAHADVAAFGTGDTQWGDRYCFAAREIARVYESAYPVLKIEQMPARNDLVTIEKWLEAMGSE